MTTVSVLMIAFALGAVDGLRSMLAPALVTWAAHLGWLEVAGSPLAFLASPVSVGIWTLLAVGELVADKLPRMSSRKLPAPFIARIVLGAACGTVLCMLANTSPPFGTLAGGFGAAAGTLLGSGARARLAQQMPDYLAALLEDAVAIGCGLFLVSRF